MQIFCERRSLFVFVPLNVRLDVVRLDIARLNVRLDVQFDLRLEFIRLDVRLDAEHAHCKTSG